MEKLRELYRFKSGKIFAVYDVKSLDVYKTNKLVWDFIGLAQDNGYAKAVESFKNRHSNTAVYQAVANLDKMGLFNRGEAKEEKDSCFDVDGAQKGRYGKTIFLNVSHDCNLACSYCYAKQGSFGGKRGLMDKDTAYKAVDFLSRITPKGVKSHIVFFGGEPLLNFKVIKDVVSYTKKKKKKIAFSITSNASLLNKDIKKYVKEQKIPVLVNIDGPARIHNQLRMFKSGLPSYDKIISNITDKSLKGLISVRSSLTEPFFNQSDKIVNHFSKDKGLEFSRVSIVPVFNYSGRYPLKRKDLKKMNNAYSRMANTLFKMLTQGEKKGIPAYPFFSIIERILTKYKITRCSIGKDLFGISYDGKIYPCQHLVGNKELCLGSVGSVLNKDRLRIFKNLNIYNISKCNICWARYLCGGSCFVHGYEVNGDFKKPYSLQCDFMLHVIKLCLELFVRLEQKDKVLLLKRIFGKHIKKGGGQCQKDTKSQN